MLGNISVGLSRISLLNTKSIHRFTNYWSNWDVLIWSRRNWSKCKACCVRQLLSIPAGFSHQQLDICKTDDLRSKTSSAGRHNLLRYDMLWHAMTSSGWWFTLSQTGTNTILTKNDLTLSKTTLFFWEGPVISTTNHFPYHPLRVLKFSGGRQPHQIGRRLEAKGLWPSGIRIRKSSSLVALKKDPYPLVNLT